eukprot:TRINITY_DN77479_c0_g1_i1.p1 TRINITY_DN77479_c0_g1~~TRINITY_DN77479_c0_g1_i1.p1  ORF type:complete len:277 (-),score=64.08 TRINITY_DN77479_c0_g1_i1:90-920(-)
MPAKFDDISKKATAVLNDDYQVSGYQLKTKQKTSFDGAVMSAQVDLWGAAKDNCMTPAKLTWKLPKPLGFSAITIDKLEMDKTGAFKLEALSEKLYPGLKVNCKSDLTDIAKITSGFTYTGLKDTQFMFDTKATAPQEFTGEITRTQGPVTFGAKLTHKNITKPDLGLNFASGPFFGALTAKEGLKVFTGACYYKATQDLQCAASYTMGGKADGNISVGLAYEIQKGLSLKAKIQQDQSVSTSVKHVVSKGFTVTAGAKYEMASGKSTYGVQLSIE